MRFGRVDKSGLRAVPFPPGAVDRLQVPPPDHSLLPHGGVDHPHLRVSDRCLVAAAGKGGRGEVDIRVVSLQVLQSPWVFLRAFQPSRIW